MSLGREFFLFFLAVAVLSGLFFFGVYWGVERAFYLFVDNHLLEDAAEFERLYSEGEEINKHEPFVLRNQRGFVVDASSLELIPPFKPDALPYIENFSFGEQTYRFITTKTSRDFYLQYGMDISQGLEFLDLLRYVLITGWVAFIFLLILFYWFFVRRSLRGLERAVRESLEGKEVKTYKEIEPLAVELRQKIRELRDQSQHYRDLLMALSHSLKTPLGRLYLKLDLFSKRHKDANLEEIKIELERIEKSSRSFLRLTKLEAQAYSPSIQSCNIRSLLEGLLKLYALPSIRAQLEDVHAQCDPELAMEVFDVLLDNAIRHGEGEVFLHLRANELRVENLSSKPVDESLLEKPESKRLGGVGLYIAKRLCQVLGWSLSMEQRKEGELHRVAFSVRFLSNGGRPLS